MEKRACRGRYGLLILITVVLTFLCVWEDKKQQDEEELAPDLVRSVSIDDSHYLTVVAYMDKIEDKEGFARMIVEMYQEDRFQTIKISKGRGARGQLPDKLYIKVYLQKEDIRKGEAVLQIRVEKGRRLYLDGVEIGGLW